MTNPKPDKMRRRGFLGTAAALGVGALAATAAGRAAADPDDGDPERIPSILPPGNWVQNHKKSDEFKGEELNLAKWRDNFWKDSAQNVLFTADSLAVSGGALRITLSERDDPPEEGPQFKGGCVRSHFTVGGDTYTEVRATMLDPKARANSAIWMLEKSTEDRNPNPEFDLQEYILGDSDEEEVRSNLILHHVDGDHIEHEPLGPWHSHRIEAPSLWKKHHMYGLERRQDVIRFYIDGELIKERSISDHEDQWRIANLPQPVILYIRGVGGGDSINAGALPKDFVIDHVRVYDLVED